MVSHAVLVLELVRALVLLVIPVGLLVPHVAPPVVPGLVLPGRVLVVLSVRPPTYLFK